MTKLKDLRSRKEKTAKINKEFDKLIKKFTIILLILIVLLILFYVISLIGGGINVCGI